MTNSKTKGVYFIANDKVIELTIAFLNSFRKFNPKISLCLIPFRDDVSEISRLKEKYNFSIYSDIEILNLCDSMSEKFHSNTIGHYRKLAIWEGPFDEFVYIDIDMLVLKNIDFAFKLLDHYNFITSCSNLESEEKWVWKDSIYQTDLLNDEQIKYAANTGFIVSSKHAITIEEIKEKLKDAVKLAPHMELKCMDQPFINYLIVTSNIKYTSLFSLMNSTLFPENYIEFWAGIKRKNMKNGFITYYKGKPHDIFLIHWAGQWQLRPIEIKLFIILNILKLRKKIWSISVFMPFKKLWKQYRYMKI